MGFFFFSLNLIRILCPKEGERRGIFCNHERERSEERGVGRRSTAMSEPGSQRDQDVVTDTLAEDRSSYVSSRQRLGAGCTDRDALGLP